MKTRFFHLLALCLVIGARALADEPLPIRPPEQLDQLFGPIALYPDALVALILPAATVPSDIVLAARFLDENRDPTQAESEPWDDSVRALIHYPDIIRWMDHNLAWTKQAGDAFLSQPADVMNSIQRLRGKARAVGALIDTPQQQVVVEDDNISIIPTQPEVIYVPTYDPEVVYIPRSGFYDEPFLTFGIGYGTGFWLGYDFDWGRRRIWSIDRRDRERYWNERHDWRRPVYPGQRNYVDHDYHFQPWQSRSRADHPTRPQGGRPRPEVARPQPFSNNRVDRPPSPNLDWPGRTDGTKGDRDHGDRTKRVQGENGAQPAPRPPHGWAPEQVRSPETVNPPPILNQPTNQPTIQAPTQPVPSTPPPAYHRERDPQNSPRPDRPDAGRNSPEAQSRPTPPPRAQPPAPPANQRSQVAPPPRPAPVSPPANADRDDSGKRGDRRQPE